MAEEINTQTMPLITLSQAAEQVPVSTNYSTVRRWATEGIKVGDNKAIRLQVIVVGGRTYTSKAWLDAFIASVEAATLNGTAPEISTGEVA